MLKKGISIIICCYNSALRIKDTLLHLAKLNTTGIDCEIILVDNASEDDTQKVAADCWAAYGNTEISFRTIVEPLPGVANARRTGINEATYEYAVFCDDDNWLSTDYLQHTKSLFNRHPEAGILSGVGIARFDDATIKPTWFDAFADGYAVGSKGDKECYVDGVYGAGMAMRTHMIKNIIGNNNLLLHGRKQNTLSAGEDAEICLRLRLQGHKILYAPQLVYQHYLPAKRLTWHYVKRLHSGFAHTYVIINLYERALASSGTTLPAFYWLKKGLYYAGIYFKYWFKQYLVYSKGMGTAEEIRHITWGIIALNYFKYNFSTVGTYQSILAYKDKS